MDNKVDIISIIIPCRNEKLFITKVLNDIVEQDYSKDRLRVYIIDGMSDDGTREIVQQYIQEYPWMKLVDNPQKTTPYAMNIGIDVSEGFLLRMDAHSSYPKNYVTELYRWSLKLNADNVGCPLITLPANSGRKAISIARNLSHPFGIGNAHFRLGTDKLKEVDTVALGFFKREVFEKVGYFDTQLIRNQDDEFNARIKKTKGKIFLIPGLKFEYYARENFSKLWRMYYQYGFFKPLAISKIKRPSNLRQLVPALFIISLITSLLLWFIFPVSIMVFLFISGLYLLINIIFSIYLKQKKDPLSIFTNMAGFIVIHFAYGFGYLKGVFVFLLTKPDSKSKEKETAISR